MVAIHIFHKLVFSARLYMKMASWGFGVFSLVFHSSGEFANHPEEMVCGVTCSSGTEVVVGRSTTEEEAVGASTGAPMEVPLSLSYHCALCWQIRDHLLWFLFSRCSWWCSMFLRSWRCVDRRSSEAQERAKAWCHHTSFCSSICSAASPSWIWKPRVEQRSARAGLWRW